MKLICSEEVTPDAFVSKFLDYMMPTKLFWRFRKYKKSWIFWSQEASTNWAIQERIITALSEHCSHISDPLLIQFWAAEMIGGRHHLTTTLQPFSFNTLTNEKSIHYRKICAGSNLVVAGGVEGENMDGIIGRVFQNQLPECSPELSYYSVKEYPQRDQALSCGFNFTIALPVFDPSQQCCVGVLELQYIPYVFRDITFLVSYINEVLKNARLETIDLLQIRNQIKNVYQGRVDNEIMAALNKVCKKHKLPFACPWVRCAQISGLDHDGFSHKSYNDFCVSGEGEFLVPIPDLMFCLKEERSRYRFSNILFNVRQGLVGKAILSRKPYLCRDACQLSVTEYPLVHYARVLGLAGCFAVCLRTIATGNHEYVVEFFLPRNERYTRNLDSLLSSILKTMKRHFKTFEVVTGDLGNGLFIEVDKSSFHKEFESFKESPNFNTQLELEILQKDGEILQSDSSYQLLIEDFDVQEQTEIAISLENIPPVKQSRAQSQEKNNSCSRKDLEQHFGKKLVDAAEILGVSRSTVKRWCRDHNIKRWPSAKRSKLCSLPKQTDVLTWGSVESISQAAATDPSCSELATNVALMPAMVMVTVKATYGEKIIKFKLSYSSRMADLEEKVIMRTRLGGGTFSMTYLDEEKDLVSVACDEDLLDCMEDLRLSGKTTIRMQIEPIANKSP